MSGSTTQAKSAVSALVGRVLIASAAVAAVMSAAVWALSGPELLVSVVAGFAAAMISFLVLVMSVSTSLSSKTRSAGSNAAIAVVCFAKLVLLGLALWWLVSRRMIEPATFLAGFTSLVIALVIEGMRMKRRGAQP